MFGDTSIRRPAAAAKRTIATFSRCEIRISRYRYMYRTAMASACQSFIAIHDGYLLPLITLKRNLTLSRFMLLFYMARQKKAGQMPCFDKMVLVNDMWRLTLGELETLTGFRAAVFFPFNNTAITSKKSASFQYRTKPRFKPDHRVANAMTNGTSLTG